MSKRSALFVKSTARLLASILVATGISVPAMTSAQATFTPMERTSANSAGWTITRVGDSAGTVAVPTEERQIVLTGNYKINPAKISPLVVDDVIMARFEVSGGDKISERGGWRWQMSGAPADSMDNASVYPSYKITSVNNTVGRFTYFVPGTTITLNGSGSLTLTPVLYINGVRQSGTIADNFVDYAPVVQWMDFSPSYTVTSQDFEVFAQAPLCLDRTKFNGNGGGSLTRSLGLKRGSDPVTGSVDNDLQFVYTSLGRSAYNSFPSPSDVFWVSTYAHSIKPNDAATNVVTGDVLTMTPSLTHNTVGDVLGGCPRFTTADPVGTQGVYDMNFTRAGAEAYAQCEFEDVATGRKVFDYKLIGTMYGVLTGCGGDGLEVEHTYRLTVRFTTYPDFRPDYQGGTNNYLGLTVSIEDFLVTIDRSTFTEPTLPGSTGPGAIVWASKNNTTESNPVHLGSGTGVNLTGNSTRGSSGSSSDGADGWVVSSRPTTNTIRVEHWGPLGRKTFNGANYVEFTDPVPSSWISRGSNAGGLGWFDSGKKWFMMQPGFQDMWITEGSFDSTATRSYRITLDEMDQTCRDFNGVHSFVNTEMGSQSLQVFSTMAPTPTVQIYCAGPEGNRGIRDLLFGQYYALIDTVSDGIGTLKKGYIPTPAKDDQVWDSYSSTSALNMKKDSVPSDIAVAFLGTYWDSVGGRTLNADQYSLVLVHNDGTVDEIKNLAWSPTVGHYNRALSLSFDSNGKLRLLVSSSADTAVDSQRYWELFDISTSGVVTKAGDLTIDADPNFNAVNGNDLSNLLLAAGVGDDTKLFARRLTGSIIGYAVINLVTNNVWTGESAALANFAQVGQTFDNDGNHFVYGRFADEFRYSVIRWGVGADPTATKGILSDDEFTIEHGTKDVETATSNIDGPTWSLDGGSHSSLFTINASTGKLEFKTVQPVGTYVVIIKATNGTDTDTQTVTIHVTDTTDPSFDLVDTVSVEVNNDLDLGPTNISETGTFTLSGTDADSFNVDPTTGRITFKTNPTEPGEYEVTLTLTDGSGNTHSETVTITVNPDSTDPELSSDETQTVVVGDLSIVTLEASEPVTWEITGGADADLFDVDADSGALSFKTAQPVGTYVVSFTLTDLSGNTSIKTVTINVVAAGVAAPKSAKFQVQSNDKTKVSWQESDGAVNYKVKRNNKVVCETRKTYCVVNAKFKRVDTVKVTAIDAQKRTATATASYMAPATPVTPPSGKTLKTTVYFDISQWRFNNKARATLFDFMLKLKRGGYKSVTITAYTDNLGNLRSDTTLSKARAKNVKRYLAYYMPKLKVTISGLGRTNPAVPNMSEAQRKQNRRAVIQASK
ncbi:MAG: hypothetical protein RLZZ426_102 [Actinomycetota bacterium]